METPTAPKKEPMTGLQRLLDNDVVWSFLHTPMAIIGAVITVVFVLAAVFLVKEEGKRTEPRF